jgi:hypothetical protein
MTLYHNIVLSTPHTPRTCNISGDGQRLHRLTYFFENLNAKERIRLKKKLLRLVWFMVFNATFNNISIISWQSVLLVGETAVPRENHRPVASH